MSEILFLPNYNSVILGLLMVKTSVLYGIYLYAYKIEYLTVTVE